MKEFVSAVEDIAAEDEREAKIAALIEQGKTREEAEAEVPNEDYVEFSIDGRAMKAYRPEPAQLAFLLAALGRGQTKTSRFAAIMNIMFESLDEDDKDYLEGRMLTRDPQKRLSMKTIEEVFEYITSEWFRSPLPDGGEAVLASQ